jgi:hypothetical protein
MFIPKMNITGPVRSQNPRRIELYRTDRGSAGSPTQAMITTKDSPTSKVDFSIRRYRARFCKGLGHLLEGTFHSL